MRLRQVFEVGPLRMQPIQVYFQLANQEVGATHGLKAVPLGYVPVRVSKGCRISEGASAPSADALQLVSDTADVNAVILVIALNLTAR